MARKIISDMVRATPEQSDNRRGIRQIPIPEHRPSPEVHESPLATRRVVKERAVIKRAIKDSRVPTITRPTPQSMSESQYLPHITHEADIPVCEPDYTPSAGNRRWKKILVGALGTLVFAGLLFFISSFFSSAVVHVTPQSETVKLNKENYLAKLNASSTTELSYELMSVSEEASKKIDATGEEQVNVKASGKIVIYNKTATAQRLINNTRFESTDGRVYRISNSVVIPGGKKVSGEFVPGSIEALVYADTYGDSYNMKMSDMKGDFTVPGFKGSPKYNEFYARLNSDITGGFSGTRKKVKPEELTTATEVLKKELKDILIKKTYSMIPETHHLFNNAYFIDYEVLPADSEGGDKYVLKIKGTIYSVIFNKSKIASYIANKKIAKNASIDFNKLEPIWSPDLVATIVNPSEKPWQDKTLSLVLDGSVDLKGVYDSNEIKAALAGKSYRDFGGIMAQFGTIYDSRADFYPAWKKTFPTESSKIKIKEN